MIYKYRQELKMAKSGKPVEKPGEKSVESVVESFCEDRAAKVERIAQDLCDRLDNPGAYEWYMKCAWHLPPSVLYGNLVIAKGGRNPQKFFTYLCKQSLQHSKSYLKHHSER